MEFSKVYLGTCHFVSFHLTIYYALDILYNISNTVTYFFHLRHVLLNMSKSYLLYMTLLMARHF